MAIIARPLLAASSALALLAGCSNVSDAPAAMANDASPMGTVLADAGGMDTIAKALNGTGLATAFEGAASYTLLAPTDAAMADYDHRLTDPESREARPVMAALIRSHMIPGYLTPGDIAKAIDEAPRGQVTMTSVDGTGLVFSQTNDGIMVSAPGGATALFADEPMRAGASIAIPLDRVLSKM